MTIHNIYSQKEFSQGSTKGLMKTSYCSSAYLQVLKEFPFIFSVNNGLSLEDDFFQQFSGRVTLSKREKFPSILVAYNLKIEDLVVIKKFSSAVFINLEQQKGLSNPAITTHIAEEAKKLNFRVFQNLDTTIASNLGQPIEFIEFILRSDESLCFFPQDSKSISALQTLTTSEIVFVLDLIQDFEILGTLIKETSVFCQPKNICVLISKRVRKSHLWNTISAFLLVLGVNVAFPANVLEASVFLPKRKGILFTASESSASGHRFCYELCRLAPATVLKVTFQHGYENVGLRHHLSHNASYQNGIRFASDVIFTWTGKNQLLNAFPSELERCIPVGVVKKSAVDAVQVRNARYGILTSKDENTSLKEQSSILLCENLHSVRFTTNPALRETFLLLMNDLQDTTRATLQIRSHPGKRLLEQDKNFEHFDFLTGELTSEILSQFDLVFSPPSTILLDAVLVGTFTAVWSATKHLGDLHNYQGLSWVKDLEDVFNLLLNPEERADLALENLAWAARNTTSFNGTCFVLSRIIELL